MSKQINIIKIGDTMFMICTAGYNNYVFITRLYFILYYTYCILPQTKRDWRVRKLKQFKM